MDNCNYCHKPYVRKHSRQLYCTRRCKERARKRPTHGKEPVNIDTKAESYKMALKLVREGRISVDMAVNCLRLSCHTKEEIDRWLKEV